MNIYYKVILTEVESEELKKMTSKGKHSSRKVVNALILLNSDEGPCSIAKKSTNKEIARVLNISERKVERVRKRFVNEGLETVLNRKSPDRVYKKKIDGDTEAHLIAISCSEPPEGFSRWSLRLLSQKMVELKYLEDVSHETVRKVLKKTN